MIYSVPEDLPTCPQCGRPIRLATRVGDSARVEPCGHYIPATTLRPAHVDESNDTTETCGVALSTIPETEVNEPIAKYAADQEARG